MRTPLRLAVAQPPCVAYDVAANAAHHAVAVRAAGARVVVFPELSLTGYEWDAPVVAEDDPRLAALVTACAETGTLALAGAPVRGDHIATLAVDGTGGRIAYRKMFLGGAEPGRFRPGGAPAVLTVDGWRLGLAICKDTGVPEQAARTAALGVDVLVASLVDKACDAHVQDDRAYRIATTHRVHVAMASCAAPTGGGFGAPAGRSALWSPDGLVLARAGTAAGEVVGAVLGQPPSPLASGRDADVYALDDDRVLRRYRRGGDVRAEAAVMAHLHTVGYPVPRVHRANGADLVLDRLTGPTLAAAGAAGDVQATSAARILADLHRRLHALPPRHALDPDDRILHLDLHPENVVLTATGPVVIDWRNATEGPPGLDVAMSAVILAEVAISAAQPIAGLVRDVLVAYLAETGPPLLLDRAVALRADLGPLSAPRLAEAAGLVGLLAASAGRRA